MKLVLLHEPAILNLGIYPKDSRSTYYRNICTCVYPCSRHNSHEMETAHMSINRGVVNENEVHIRNEILFRHWARAFAGTWLQLEIVLREISQIQANTSLFFHVKHGINVMCVCMCMFLYVCDDVGHQKQDSERE